MLMSVWQDDIVGDGKLAEFLLLASFLLSWGFIRTSTHMIRAQVKWWPGNVSVKGRRPPHGVRHPRGAFFGYIGLAFGPGSPWREICAVGFGIGMGLTLDEFALWLELRDVYWLPDGRKSIDAVIVTGVAGCCSARRPHLDRRGGRHRGADEVRGRRLVRGRVRARRRQRAARAPRGRRRLARPPDRGPRGWSCCGRRRTRSGSACGSATSPPAPRACGAARRRRPAVNPRASAPRP